MVCLLASMVIRSPVWLKMRHISFLMFSVSLGVVYIFELLHHPGELRTSHHPSSQSWWILRETNCASFPFNISILLPVRKMCTSRRCSYPEGRSIYSTYGDGILSSVERTEMRLLVPCTHEEADTRLTVHVLDATYVWGQTFFYQPVLPSASDRGWWQLNNSWSPFWTALPLAKECCHELIRCGYRASFKGPCNCLKANLACTGLCNCGGLLTAINIYKVRCH